MALYVDHMVKPADNESVPLENHYTVSEAARMLGVSIDAIYLAIKKKQLVARLVGKTYFIHKDDLTKYRSEKRSPGRPRTKRSYTRKSGD